MAEELQGKRVLVTAGCRGIGRAIAASLAGAGARVHVCDIDPEALTRLREEAPELGCSRADVADPGQVESLFTELRENLGGIDILVNNAGIAGPTGPIEDCEPAAWRRTLAVNLDAAYLCCRQAVPLMKAQGSGSIVNISSTAGLFGYPLRAPYAAAKWAIIGLTKTLAMELGPEGIRVNAVCPGSVEGPRMDGVIENEARARDLPPQVIRDGYLRQSALRTFVTTRDIAEMVRFLCTASAAKVSGQVMSVDGYTETIAN
jgi:NAD(P)-dependent dehydrogenase (short-subunit alcohol dehydrogenase family)